METKKEIRTRIIKERAALDPEMRQAFSDKIFEQIISHPLYRHAREIYCYVSFGEEVSTEKLISYSLKMGKKVAVPKIIVDNSAAKENTSGFLEKSAAFKQKRRMEFYYIESTDELSKGYFGIMEPPEKAPACGDSVLVIMPGVAFDRQCNRIGYGKGFYDFYLRQHPWFRKIALAYSVQCLGKFSAEKHDIRPEMIITEEEIYTC
ncbi:5-formyltetrahydrofolate cyclo-ligase [Clostridium sp. C105KSO13]|uniref:5-formyltetrahydrofolate cyclo-ligase n=1 Tax=Clostridium sp. C105KSO13 TaxID=1776045 RepID=UPI0007405A72|nr:5-formyltetrahydrofolate cyclo-ligase [Clostridium sp. C105KSO13]CUX50358.1 5-formyltetrahydrofolate cyclo-ligase family protein [Clostridium sp. C105KSO13]